MQVTVIASHTLQCIRAVSGTAALTRHASAPSVACVSNRGFAQAHYTYTAAQALRRAAGQHACCSSRQACMHTTTGPAASYSKAACLLQALARLVPQGPALARRRVRLRMQMGAVRQDIHDCRPGEASEPMTMQALPFPPQPCACVAGAANVSPHGRG
jgi:hypothetical protein